MHCGVRRNLSFDNGSSQEFITDAKSWGVTCSYRSYRQSFITASTHVITDTCIKGGRGGGFIESLQGSTRPQRGSLVLQEIDELQMMHRRIFVNRPPQFPSTTINQCKSDIWE
jgi:hypothetical protein